MASNKAARTGQGTSFVLGGGNKPLGMQMCQGEPSTGHFPKSPAGPSELILGLAPSGAKMKTHPWHPTQLGRQKFPSKDLVNLA